MSSESIDEFSSTAESSASQNQSPSEQVLQPWSEQLDAMSGELRKGAELKNAKN